MSHTTNTPPDHPSPLLRIITLSLTSLFLLLTILTSLLTLSIRYLPKLLNNPLSLRARAPILQLFSVWGLCLQIMAWCFVASVPAMNCSTLMILSNIGWYSFLVSMLLRGWRLYYIFHWNAREIKEMIRRERMAKKRLRRQDAFMAVTKEESADTLGSSTTRENAVEENQASQRNGVSNGARRPSVMSAMEKSSLHGSAANLLRRGSSLLGRSDSGNASGATTTTTNAATNLTDTSAPQLVDKCINTRKSTIAAIKILRQGEWKSLSSESTSPTSEHKPDAPPTQPQSTPHYNRPQFSSIDSVAEAAAEQTTAHSDGMTSSAVHSNEPQVVTPTSVPVVVTEGSSQPTFTSSPNLYNPATTGAAVTSAVQPIAQIPPTAVSTLTTTTIATQSTLPPLQRPVSTADRSDVPPLQRSTAAQRTRATTQPPASFPNNANSDSGGIFSRIRNTISASSNIAAVPLQQSGGGIAQNYPSLSFTMDPMMHQGAGATQPQFLLQQQYYLPNAQNLTNATTNADYLFHDTPQQHALPPFPSSSPLQSFSLLTTSADSYQHQQQQLSQQLASNQPQISPTILADYLHHRQAVFSDTPSMGHLNLTYHDLSTSNHNRRANGAHPTLYDGVSPAVPLEQAVFLNSPTPDDNNDITSRDAPMDTDALSGSGELVSDWMEILQLHVKESTTNINKRRANEKNLLIFFFIGLITTLLFLIPITIFMPRFYIPHSFLCDINIYTYPTTELEPRSPNQFPIFEFIFSLIAVFMMLIGIFKLRRVRDTYHLNTELRVMGVLVMFGALLYGVVLPFASDKLIIPLSLFFTWYAMLTIPLVYYPYVYMLHLVSHRFVKWRRRFRNPHLPPQEEKSPALRGMGDPTPPFNPNSLNSILQNLTLRDMLKKHMVHSLCSELITFYEQVSLYKTTYDENFPEASIKLASDIVDTYIIEECPKPIHLPKQMRNDIIQEVTNAVDSVPLALLDDATRYVLHTIRKDGTFSSFKRSRKFRKWLKQEKEKKIEEVIERAGGLLEDDE